MNEAASMVNFLLLSAAACQAQQQNSNEVYGGIGLGAGEGLQLNVTVGEYSLERYGPGFQGGSLELAGLDGKRSFSLNYDLMPQWHGDRFLHPGNTKVFTTAGLTQIKEDGLVDKHPISNGLNFGAGILFRGETLHFDNAISAARFEVRDYWTPKEGHVVFFRVVWQRDFCIFSC